MAKRLKKMTSVVSLPVDEDVILDIAKQIIRQRFQPKAQLTSVSQVRDYLGVLLATEPREVFGVLYLDNSHQILGFEILFQGTIDGAHVYSREVLKQVMAYNSAAVILVHNHPSGIAEPSEADIRLTGRLKSALALIDVRILDHLIVAGTEMVSLAERGVMP